MAGLYSNFVTDSTGASNFLSWLYQHMIWPHPFMAAYSKTMHADIKMS